MIPRMRPRSMLVAETVVFLAVLVILVCLFLMLEAPLWVIFVHNRPVYSRPRPTAQAVRLYLAGLYPGWPGTGKHILCVKTSLWYSKKF